VGRELRQVLLLLLLLPPGPFLFLALFFLSL
jgi:hypothetical protein